MQIRAATTDDIPALQELWKEFMDFHQARDPFFTRAEDGHMRWAEFLAVNLERDDWLVLIAVDGDLPVGYCMASVIEYPPVLTTPRYGFIQDMAVTAAYRRRGLATRLYLRAEQWLREKGSPRVELHVLLASETACAFWRRMGFREHVARMAKSFETGS